ncbi:MAG: hypothetical protein GY846_24785, partial [Deltaproteobacteria bacterium]|nr:hypothetical protein [Deltaproteobacteria bacterium]
MIFTTCGYGVIRSEFDGSQWQHSYPVPGGTYASNIGFAPGNPNVVYATWFFPSFFGGDNLPRISRSTDGGDTWETFMVDTTAATVLLTLAVHPTDSDIVFCGDNELGVVKTPTHGQTWTSLNNGLNYFIVYDVALDPNDIEHKIAGTEAGLFEKKENGAWE